MWVTGMRGNIDGGLQILLLRFYDNEMTLLKTNGKKDDECKFSPQKLNNPNKSLNWNQDSQPRSIHFYNSTAILSLHPTLECSIGHCEKAFSSSLTHHLSTLIKSMFIIFYASNSSTDNNLIFCTITL